MGAGRRTQAFVLNDNTSPSSSTEASFLSYGASSSRFWLLEKCQLGGVIFGCPYYVDGLPAPHIAYVMNIDPGLRLFLFNFNIRKLHGIFEASSRGQLNIDQQAWTTDGSQRTAYPAQHERSLTFLPANTILQLAASVSQSQATLLICARSDMEQADLGFNLWYLSSHVIASSASAPKPTKERRIKPLDTQQKGFLEQQTKSDCPLGIAQLMKEIEDLKAFNTDQSQRMEYLEQKLVKAETEIQRRKDRCTNLEAESNMRIWRRQGQREKELQGKKIGDQGHEGKS